MATLSIITIMHSISVDVQRTFEELTKLLIRKILAPPLNPLYPKANMIYNNYLKKNQRTRIGFNNDAVNKYNYLMTYDSIGWTDDIFANFKMVPKFNKNYTTTKNHKNKRAKIPFTDQERELGKNPLHRALPSIISIIANKKTTLGYSSDIPYPSTFKQLESIGRNILDQTNPFISGSDSLKMSTATLRNRLYNLERDLYNLSISYPNLYDDYIKMIRTINSICRNKVPQLLNLIALLSVQSWINVSEYQKNKFLSIFGEAFINDLVTNNLANILLQSESFELILTTSYLYPILKMLFVVFGYSRLVPSIDDGSYENNNIINNNIANNNNIINNNITSITAELNANSDADVIIYDYIRFFGEMYPTLISLMGGTEIFPQLSIPIICDMIPQNYQGLVSIPEYLWRFNDFSYCEYKKYVDSKQLIISLNAKKNDRIQYLYTI